MSMAPPGFVTGRFYIILGYIPRRRSWQELKDFVHQAGFQVVHVQIHTGLHSGWISVDGEDNFWRLGEWLERAEWDGNRFQVDMRNYDQETPLGPSSYVLPENPQLVRSRVAPVATTLSMNGNPGYAYSYGPAMQVATTQAYVCGTSGYAVTSPQQYTYGGQAGFTAPLQQPLMYRQVEPTSIYQYPQYNYPTASHIASSFSQPLYATAGPSIPATTVRVENRRLHLTRIPGASSDKEIRKRVLAACPSNIHGPIDQIEIPQHPDGRQRGHALILLQTEELANRVREKLNGMAVRSPEGGKHVLKVKFAQEGATEMRGELAMQMRLGLGGRQECEQGQLQQQIMQLKEQAGATKAPQPAGEPERSQGRRRSSLPIANGSLSIPGSSMATGFGFSGSAVFDDSMSDELVGNGNGKGSSVAKEKHGHREKEKDGKRLHGYSSGKSGGKNKKK